MSNVNINIAAEFTGKQEFKKADKQVTMLTSQVKRLAGAFGVTFGAAALARYSQNAVKAFADSQLEAVQLTNAVKNLGLAFASKDLDIYIDKVERATGINRDQLQPAMIKLLQVTGSIEKSQELLNLAMDVAAGSGQDLASTSEKLSQAYVGNFKGLRSLNLGLTQAELKSTNFEEVQKRLQVLFAGQATSAANSYVGSMNKLAIASEQASEKIGKSLLDALTAVSGGKTVDDTIRKIDTLSSAIAGLIDVTVGLKAGEYLQQYYALKDGAIAGGFGNRSMSVLGQDTQRADLAARQKAEADAKRRAAELLKAQNALLKSQKDQVKLNKAKAIFDLQKIQIEAALKGKISEEDRARLLLMQAIEEQNISNIEKYTKLLDEAQKKTIELRDALKVADPFATFNSGALNAIENIKAINAALKLGQFVPVVPGTGGVMGGSTNAGNYPSSGFPGASVPYAPTSGGGNTTVNVTVQGSVIAENNLAQTINDAIASSNQSGSAVGYTRQAGLTAV